MTSLANIILSILSTKDKALVGKKLETIENQLVLNEVEKKIIKDIKDNLFLDDLLTPAFIRQKYSYYAVNDEMVPEEPLQLDSIDSAITQLRLHQLKSGLSKDLLKLSGQITTMSPDEIKTEISSLHKNVLVESRYDTPDNTVIKKVDPYSDLVASRGGLSLLLPSIEKHAGKASLGTTVSILAAPGHFKSAMALNIAYKNALDGFNILYLTLEDTAEKLIMRLVLNHIAVTAKGNSKLVDSSQLRDGKLSKEKQKLYNDKHNEMVDLLDNHLIIWDTDDFHYDTFLDMENTLRMADKMFFEKTGKGLEAVIVDHVSLLKYTVGSGKKYGYDGAVINDWVLFFNNQALNFLDEGRQIVFFPLSQVKRDAFAEVSKEKKKGRYELDCASDASEIERISTTMITLYKDYETRGTLLINIPKAREGFAPENPLQAEVYGEYFHIGPLDNIYSNSDTSITVDDFTKNEFKLSDLIQRKEEI